MYAVVVGSELQGKRYGHYDVTISIIDAARAGDFT